MTLGATDQGMVAGDLVNTASRLQSVGGARDGPRRRGDPASRLAGDRLRAGGRPGPQGQGRPRRRVAGPARRRRAVRSRARRPARGAVRRPRRGAAAPQGPVPRHVAGAAGRARLDHRPGRHRQVPPRLGVREVRRRRRRAASSGTTAARPAYGEGITFWALGRDGPQPRRARRDRRRRARPARGSPAMLDEFVPDEAERRWIEPALLALLGRRRGAAGRARRAVRAPGARSSSGSRARAPSSWSSRTCTGPTPGLLDFIDHLLEWSRGVPILIITLARPGPPRAPARTGALAGGTSSPSGSSRSTTTRCASCSPGSCPGCPAAAVRSIVDRADGIPLYAVETVRMLVGDGRLREVDGRYEPVGELGELAVPETLQALIAARLDGLDAGGPDAPPGRRRPRPELHPRGPGGRQRRDRGGRRGPAPRPRRDGAPRAARSTRAHRSAASTCSSRR